MSLVPTHEIVVVWEDGWKEWAQYAALHPDIYWIPDSNRWATFDSEKYLFWQIPEMDPVPPAETAIQLIYPVGVGLKAAGFDDAIWWPKDGRWYVWQSRGASGDPRPEPGEKQKRPPIPDWVKRMNAELAALEHANLDPAEKERMRAQIIANYSARVGR